MVFKFSLNGRRVSCPFSFEGRSKCKNIYVKPKKVESIDISELYKMERSIAFAKAHKDKALSEIMKKLITKFTSEIPNAFWSREQYFISFHFKIESKRVPFKASATFMSPFEQKFCQK